MIVILIVLLQENFRDAFLGASYLWLPDGIECLQLELLYIEPLLLNFNPTY
ncbi:MAG: hypothetical protein ACTSRI_08110 [Promethearchaeota archaeon]